MLPCLPAYTGCGRVPGGEATVGTGTRVGDGVSVREGLWGGSGLADRGLSRRGNIPEPSPSRCLCSLGLELWSPWGVSLPGQALRCNGPGSLLQPGLSGRGLTWTGLWACPILTRMLTSRPAGLPQLSPIAQSVTQHLSSLSQNLTPPRNNRAPHCSPGFEEGGNLARRGAERGEREEMCQVGQGQEFSG